MANQLACVVRGRGFVDGRELLTELSACLTERVRSGVDARLGIGDDGGRSDIRADELVDDVSELWWKAQQAAVLLVRLGCGDVCRALLSEGPHDGVRFGELVDSEGKLGEVLEEEFQFCLKVNLRQVPCTGPIKVE